MKRCYACIHPEREAIDAELVRGELSLRTIAARFSSPDHPLSATGIYRHRLKHVEEPTVGDIMEPEAKRDRYMMSGWLRYNESKEWEKIPRPDPHDLVELRGRRPQEGYYLDYGTKRPRKRKMYRRRRTRRRRRPAPEGYAWVTDAAGNRVLMRSGR